MPTLTGTLVAAGTSTFVPVGGPILQGSLFNSTFAQAFWEPYIPSSLLTADASSTAAFVGSGLSVLVSVGGYEYQPLPLSEFDGSIRRDPAISIRHSLGQPSVMTCRVIGVEPVTGEEVTIDFGDGLLFSGTITDVTQVTEDARENVAWDITATDHLWRLNARYPVACFRDVSASTVIASLFADWAPDFGTANVAPGLPNITRELKGDQSMNEVLQSIADELGATFKANVGGFDPYFYITSPEDQPEQLNNTTNQTLLHEPSLQSTEDFTQVGNRVLVYGAQLQMAEDAEVGATELSVTDIALVASTSGFLAIGCQRVGYGGAKITKTIPPRSGAPSGFQAVLERDVFGRATNGDVKTPCAYAVSFMTNGVESQLSSEIRGSYSDAYQINAVGESGSPLSTSPGGAVPHGVQLNYHVSAFTATGEAFSGGGGGTSVVLAPTDSRVEISLNPCGDLRFIGWHIWRTKGNPGPGDFGPGGIPLYFLVGTVSGSPSTPSSFMDTQPDSSLTQAAPIDENGYQFQGQNSTGGVVLVKNIPTQAGSTRKLYRALVNVLTGTRGDFVQITTLPETGTTYRDTTPSPSFHQWEIAAGNTSVEGGTRPPGDLPPIFRAIITGVSGVTERIPKGTTIELFLAKDDIPSQVALAAKMGGDGVREFVVRDAKLQTSDALNRRADAELFLRSQPRRTVEYETLDPKSVVGTFIDINMTDPPLVANLKIQDVTVTDINEGEGGSLPAKYRVSASSNKFTINDLLRRVVIK